MARTFIYDGREFPDPDASKTPEEVKRILADFFPEVANADIKEHKREDGTAYEFIRKVGVKGSWKVEVVVAGETAFVGNGVRLATQQEAEIYGSDLACRWLAVKQWRAVESPDPVNSKFEMGQLVSCVEV